MPAGLPEMTKRMFKLTAISNFANGTEHSWDVEPDCNVGAIEDIIGEALEYTDCSSWVFTIIRLKDAP